MRLWRRCAAFALSEPLVVLASIGAPCGVTFGVVKLVAFAAAAVAAPDQEVSGGPIGHLVLAVLAGLAAGMGLLAYGAVAAGAAVCEAVRARLNDEGLRWRPVLGTPFRMLFAWLRVWAQSQVELPRATRPSQRCFLLPAAVFEGLAGRQAVRWADALGQESAALLERASSIDRLSNYSFAVALLPAAFVYFSIPEMLADGRNMSEIFLGRMLPALLLGLGFAGFCSGVSLVCSTAVYLKATGGAPARRLDELLEDGVSR